MTNLQPAASTTQRLHEILSHYEKCPILPSLALSDTWTHQSEPNPWPTVPLWEETDVGNVAHSFSLTLTHEKKKKTNKLANWHNSQRLRTETAYRTDIQHTREFAHIQPRPKPEIDLYYFHLLFLSNSSFRSQVSNPDDVIRAIIRVIFARSWRINQIY